MSEQPPRNKRKEEYPRECERSEVLASIWRGFRNAVIAGYRIRLPYIVNAAVMAALSRGDKGSQSRLKFAIKQLFWHSHNLSVFVALYKSVCSLLRNLGLRNGWDSVIGGAVGGWVAFGSSTGISGAVNQQINLYLFARAVEGAIKALTQKYEQYVPEWLDIRKPMGFRIFTSVTIAVSMYLMDYQPRALREGLTQAMHSIYWQADSGSTTVPWNFVPLVLATVVALVGPRVSPKLSVEHLCSLF